MTGRKFESAELRDFDGHSLGTIVFLSLQQIGADASAPIEGKLTIRVDDDRLMRCALGAVPVELDVRGIGGEGWTGSILARVLLVPPKKGIKGPGGLQFDVQFRSYRGES